MLVDDGEVTTSLGPFVMLLTASTAPTRRRVAARLGKVPIPEFDAGNPLHREVAEAGAAAALGASGRLAELRSQRGEGLTVTIARRELRAWLRGSAEGAAVEGVVGALLK